MKLLVIIGSTRTNRNAGRVKNWLTSELTKRTNAEYDIVDLRDVNLPFYDEVGSVGGLEYEEYQHPEAVAWGRQIEQADGFIFVTSEYNHAPPATIKNAIDYAWKGWNYKPMSIISYSTGSIAGARAAEQLRLMSLGVRLLPLPTAVHIGNLTDVIDEDGKVDEAAGTNKALAATCDELESIASKLKG